MNCTELRRETAGRLLGDKHDYTGLQLRLKFKNNEPEFSVHYEGRIVNSFRGVEYEGKEWRIFT